MSTTPESHQQEKTSKDIPVRRVVLNDPSQLPLDYGTTPGGSIFSTTPGGTRIVYERKFLLQCRNSPHSLSPPCNLPTIPGVTEPEEISASGKLNSLAEEQPTATAVRATPKENIAPADTRKSQERSGEDIFQMDM